MVTSDSQPSSSSVSVYDSRALAGLSAEDCERHRRDREAWLDMLEAEEEEEWRSTRWGVGRGREPSKANSKPSTPIPKEPRTQSQHLPCQLRESTVLPFPLSQSQPSELSTPHRSKKNASALLNLKLSDVLLPQMARNLGVMLFRPA